MNGAVSVVTPSPVIRWTIGDVSNAGFETLRCSVWGAHRIFTDRARYVICLNTMPLDEARDRAGELPADVEWRVVTRDDLPPFIRSHLDAALAEGVGWKFAPLLLDPNRPELALDNDCILWGLPNALRRWREGDGQKPVMAEDVRVSFGQFVAFCGDRPRNSGIRALPARFDLEWRLREVFTRVPVIMRSEFDEQGLQAAALSLDGDLAAVRLDEVTISSPFPPHLPGLGRCGVHFVGVNAHSLPIQAHWNRWRDEVVARTLTAPEPSARVSAARAGAPPVRGKGDGLPPNFE